METVYIVGGQTDEGKKLYLVGWALGGEPVMTEYESAAKIFKGEHAAKTVSGCLLLQDTSHGKMNLTFVSYGFKKEPATENARA